jgi:ADP-heptose:LPS heptosyltransferase
LIAVERHEFAIDRERCVSLQPRGRAIAACADFGDKPADYPGVVMIEPVIRSDPADEKPPAASPPAGPLPPRGAGNGRVEVISGPRGALAICHSVVDKREGRRLLVLKLDHYGDFLIGLPALQRLRQAFPADHITLVCGSWNVPLARRLGVADEVHAYDFFPENGALWNGKAFENIQRFREICREPFDIAVDLRVDEDTRFLLKHVEAATKCGIGSRARNPFLDILLPPQFERRDADGQWLLIEPDRFQSRMPRRTPLFHENDFSVNNTYLVFGPDVVLPPGRVRAHFGLRLLTPFPLFPGVRIVIDVAREQGTKIDAAAKLKWTWSGDPRRADLAFTNSEPGAAYEFRVHAWGWPIRARLRFHGVALELLDAPSARFKPAELHIGEQLSLLVHLIEQRTRKLQDDEPIPARPVSFDFPVLSGLGASAKRIVIAPVSNSQIRDWGIMNYAKLVGLLLEKTACCVVLVGSKMQRDEIDSIVEQNNRDRRIINLAGAADWSETTEIVRKADLVISNNSGIAHLAAACGTATLAIYSGTHQPQEWGPRGDRVHAITALVPCSPCGYDKLELCPNDHLCMKQIAPATIADHAIAMLHGTRPVGGPQPASSPAKSSRKWP